VVQLPRSERSAARRNRRSRLFQHRGFNIVAPIARRRRLPMTRELTSVSS
jgi:hypothetical protein